MTQQEILRCVDHTLLSQTATWADIREICDDGARYGVASVCIPPCYVREAIRDGASEIDMVINLGWLRDGDFAQVEQEIRTLKEVCGERILKVIIETCLLTQEEKMEMCRIVTAAGADFIKTSTGFSTAGATFEDIELFARHVGPGVRIKAAGGISSLADGERFLQLGASRLGTSRIVKLVKG